MDDYELDPALQAVVAERWSHLSPATFRQLGDIAGLRQEFMALNGFGLAGMDYQAEVSLEMLQTLRP
jgi:enoyl-[acyl-carrier protein] reductase/trans-2-enoyl-CoA reductase (NAD+)